MRKLYEDVNDLYTDEHRVMAQADLLEQMYSMLHELNMVARDRHLIMEKREQASEGTEIIDPDKFPINRLSADIVKERESLWDVEPTLLDEIEHFHGHSLRVR